MTESEKIKQRFYDAFNTLVKVRIVYRKKDFYDRYGIVAPTFLYCEKNLSSGMFEIEWIAYLCRDYGVRMNYIMYDDGLMFNKPTHEKVHDILAGQRR